MRLVCISDTHGRHRELDLPEGDVLIHAGDITPNGKIHHVVDFLEWFNFQTKFQHRIYIAGNHDFLHEDKPEYVAKLHKEHFKNTGSYYLNETSIEIDKIRFFGTPWTPYFHGWAFNAYPGADIQRHWELIPKSTNVLIVHGPVSGILDRSLRDERVGCLSLLEHVKSLYQLKAVICGHIHEQGGKVEKQFGLQFVNAAILNGDAAIRNPIVIDI